MAVATKRSEIDGALSMIEGEPPRGDSCLGRADMDEPIFILRANDRTSSKTVRFWVQAARDAGCQNEEKLEEAIAWAVEAEKWRNARGGGKVPD